LICNTYDAGIFIPSQPASSGLQLSIVARTGIIINEKFAETLLGLGGVTRWFVDLSLSDCRIGESRKISPTEDNAGTSEATGRKVNQELGLYSFLVFIDLLSNTCFDDEAT
jgi:hypothetical protein